MEHLHNCTNQCDARTEVAAKPESQYDVISHEIGNNLLSIKLQKNSRRIEDLNGLDDGKSSDKHCIEFRESRLPLSRSNLIKRFNFHIGFFYICPIDSTFNITIPYQKYWQILWLF